MQRNIVFYHLHFRSDDDDNGDDDDYDGDDDGDDGDNNDATAATMYAFDICPLQAYTTRMKDSKKSRNFFSLLRIFKCHVLCTHDPYCIINFMVLHLNHHKSFIC